MITRKLLCAVALVLLCVMAFPALAEISLYPESMTVYMGGKNGVDYEATDKIAIQGLEKAIGLDAVTSSNDAVVRADSVEMSLYRSESRHTGDYIYQYIDADIIVTPCGKGSATITVDVDGERASAKLNVLPYVNPAKRFVISSVTDENIKSLFDDCSFVDKQLPQDIEKGVLAIEAADGWRVTEVEWFCFNQAEVYNYSWTSGVSAMQMAIPAMIVEREYTVRAEFVNEKTRGSITLLLQI